MAPNVHLNEVQVLPVALMKYTQSLSSLREYKLVNPDIIGEYEHRYKGIQETFDQNIERRSSGAEGKRHNQMIEHHVMKHSREVLRHLLQS
ncbi:MAG: hypothetical protein ACI9S8_000458 [Chlamydiales bacterium]|jgi:hypothetical protein